MWMRNLFHLDEDEDLLAYKLARRDLYPMPRLLLWFITKNVMPHTSDKDKVRLFEVMIL